MGVLAITSGIVTITNKNPLVSAISLVFLFFMFAGIYITLNAQFVAIMQILVYAGAIMVLVVFVIMLLNLGSEQKIKEKFKIKYLIAGIFGLALLFQIISIVLVNEGTNKSLPEISMKLGTIENIGDVLFSKYLFPFEAIGVLLLAAIVGAVILAKKKLE